MTTLLGLSARTSVARHINQIHTLLALYENNFFETKQESPSLGALPPAERNYFMQKEQEEEEHEEGREISSSKRLKIGQFI